MKRKRKMQKVQRRFFLEKMGPSGLIIRGKNKSKLTIFRE
jgi:hypothetical protein